MIHRALAHESSGPDSDHPAEALARVLTAAGAGRAVWSPWQAVVGFGVVSLAAGPSPRSVASEERSVWPHGTVIAYEGLRRYGFDDAAMDLAGDLLDALALFDDRLPELSADTRQPGDFPVYSGMTPTTKSPPNRRVGANATRKLLAPGIQQRVDLVSELTDAVLAAIATQDAYQAAEQHLQAYAPPAPSGTAPRSAAAGAMPNSPTRPAGRVHRAGPAACGCREP
jgi:hypothetical protein